MPRIQPIPTSEARGETRRLLEGVRQGLGMVPNLLKTLGHSSPALSGYLGLSQALGRALDPPLRERLALAVAGANRCSYCASAHTALGTQAGLGAEEMAANLRGESEDARTRAALGFALAVVESRGRVTDQDLDDVRAAGFSDAQIVEIVAVIALNLFTNYLNHVAETEIDFPVVDAS